jgi:hypothetical protein
MRISRLSKGLPLKIASREGRTNRVWMLPIVRRKCHHRRGKQRARQAACRFAFFKKVAQKRKAVLSMRGNLRISWQPSANSRRFLEGCQFAGWQPSANKLATLGENAYRQAHGQDVTCHVWTGHAPIDRSGEAHAGLALVSGWKA